MPGICRDCGHSRFDHYSGFSKQKPCLLKDCKCKDYTHSIVLDPEIKEDKENVRKKTK